MTTSTATTTRAEPAWLSAARQPRWTPEVAAQVVRAWQEEGGPQSAFLRKHGLPRGRLRFWTQRREEKVGGGAAMSFVPVEVAGGAPRKEEAVAGESAVVVEVGGVRVRVEEGASQAQVVQVLRAVKEVQGC